ncbi:uncharacterized protein [Nicotiana sylvestris]|uniref:uncharacterized protein n=1 Tax=Nicotiana sylvestris TaxID=4096 RepID=UPI00388C4D76
MVQTPRNHLQNEHATQSGLNQGNQVNGIDYNHPLFLSPADVSGIQIISFQLAGIENYSIWFRSMRVALLGRNKLGLVDGTCSKEKFPEMMWNHWERVNAIVLFWIMNSVAKGLLGGIMYASSTQVIWEDLVERFNMVDGSRTFNLHKKNCYTVTRNNICIKIETISILDGTKRFLFKARSQILMICPTPTVNQAYALIVSDEGQKSVAATS